MALCVQIDEFLFHESHAQLFATAARALVDGRPGARVFLAKERRQGRGNGLILTEHASRDAARTGWQDSQLLADAVAAGTILPIWEDLRFVLLARADKPAGTAGNGPRWVQLTETTCAPEHDAAFNRWYTDIHLADAMHRPGYLSAARFEVDAYRNGRGKYLTIYEIETDDIDATMDDQARRTAAGKAAGRGSDLPIAVWNKVLFRQIAGPLAGR